MKALLSALIIFLSAAALAKPANSGKPSMLPEFDPFAGKISSGGDYLEDGIRSLSCNGKNSTERWLASVRFGEFLKATRLSLFIYPDDKKISGNSIYIYAEQSFAGAITTEMSNAASATQISYVAEGAAFRYEHDGVVEKATTLLNFELQPVPPPPGGEEVVILVGEVAYQDPLTGLVQKRPLTCKLED